MQYRHWIVATFVVSFSCATTPQQANQTNLTQTTIPPTTSAKPITAEQSSYPICFGGKEVWNICWLSTPPYVYNNNPENSTNVEGILIDALLEGLKICSCKTKMNFTMVNTLNELLNCSKSEHIDIVLPFPTKKATFKTWVFSVVDSPNIYLLLSRKTIESEAKTRVLSEFFSVWTITVLTVLLAIIFGIIVWFLDMTWNTEQFPRTFIPGCLEGVWWSFVTLTTVGYGDKTPKFPLARIFAVIWMFVGMGMVSLLTATMTKALTTAVFDNQNYIQSKTIGVLNRSYTYDEAVKKGAQPYVFPNLDLMYKTLDEGTLISGILVDIFVATYVKNNPERFAISSNLFVARSYDVVYSLAFYLGRGITKNIGLGPVSLYHFSHCFRPTFQATNNKIDVYRIVDKYIQPPSDDGHSSSNKQSGIKLEIDLFSSTEPTFLVGVQILGGVLAVLITLGIIWQITYRKHLRSTNFSPNRKGFDVESINMTPHNRRDANNIKILMEKLGEVDNALNKLSEFREMFEKYKKETKRFDSGIVNGTANHAPSASANLGYTSTSRN